MSLGLKGLTRSPDCQHILISSEKRKRVLIRKIILLVFQKDTESSLENTPEDCSECTAQHQPLYENLFYFVEKRRLHQQI